HLVRKPVLLRTPQRSRDDHAVPRTDHQSANDFHQRFPADTLQLAPQLVRPLNEGDVQRVLEVRLPYDATVPVRGTHRVFWPELLESKRSHAAPGEVKEGRATHSAKSDDNHIVATRLGHRALSCTDSCNSAAADS